MSLRLSKSILVLSFAILCTPSFSTALALDSRPPDAIELNNSGVTLAAAGKDEEAIEVFKLAIRLRPDFANAHYNLGSEYQRLGNFAAAIEEFNQALSLQPCYAQA